MISNICQKCILGYIFPIYIYEYNVLRVESVTVKKMEGKLWTNAERSVGSLKRS